LGKATDGVNPDGVFSVVVNLLKVTGSLVSLEALRFEMKVILARLDRQAIIVRTNPSVNGSFVIALYFAPVASNRSGKFDFLQVRANLIATMGIIDSARIFFMAIVNGLAPKCC
jgi:hypothetical protein